MCGAFYGDERPPRAAEGRRGGCFSNVRRWGGVRVGCAGAVVASPHLPVGGMMRDRVLVCKRSNIVSRGRLLLRGREGLFVGLRQVVRALEQVSRGRRQLVYAPEQIV